MKRQVLLATVSVAFLALAAAADTLELKDGRIIDNRRMTVKDDGVVVHYTNGDVFIPKARISEHFAISESGEFTPRTDEEKAKFEKGLLPWQGKWIPKSRWERERDKRRQEIEERAAKAKAGRKWTNRAQEQSANFKYEYTIPEATAKEFIDLFEIYFKTFAKHWGVRRGKEPKLKVCFYHDQDYFLQVTGVPSGVLGYFRFVDPKELNVYNITNDREMTIGVIFHEVNHYLVNLIDPKFHYPPWVGEGLAEYYGCSKWDPQKKKLTVGHLQEGRLVIIKDDIEEGDKMSISDLIHMEQATGHHYTWGWALCHYLLETKKYAKNFKKFVLAMSKSKRFKKKDYAFGMMTVGPEETLKHLEKYLKTDLATLEKEWHEYVEKKLDVQSARGFENAARMARRNGFMHRARRYWRKAIETGDASARVYYDYGRALLYGKADRKKAQEMFREAIKRAPLNAYAYMELGRLLCREGKRKEGKRMMQLALEIDPDDDGLYFRFEQDLSGV